MSHSKFFSTWARFCLVLCIGLLALSALAQDPSSRNLIVGATSKRLALVIGNDAYKNVDVLKNARNDARLMAATLKKAGFDVTQVVNMGRDGMWSSIDTFKGRINKGDEVVFYYAGHGVQINSNQLLLPVDISTVNDSQVQRDAVSLVDVQDALKDARFALLVIDACRDNPFPKTGGRSIGGGTRGLLPPEPVTGQVIVMSAGRNQKALDSVPGESQANGLFTWELAQAIQAPGVEIRVALERVKDSVDDKAKSVGHEQRPGMVSDLRGNFYFFGPTTVQVQGGTSPPDPETRTWDAAESANSLAAYQAYLRAYPKGKYVAAAEIKLDALKQSATQIPVPAKTPPATSADLETAFWNEVKASGAREYLDAYFKQYPKGKYLALAKIELKKLDDKEQAERGRQAAQRNQDEQTAWSSAKSAGTQAAYSGYLGSYPGGQFATLAQAAQQRLKREAEDNQRQEAQRLAEQQRKQREDAERVAMEMRPGRVFKDCADCPEMVVIPAGNFQMGSNDGNADEKPVHSSSIRSIAMGKFEVTQGQWQALMGSNPSHFTQCGQDCPVEQVSWDDAQVFIQRLNAKTGKSYRLPSESEWEYACRAGSRQEYCGSDNVDAVAWYTSNSGGKTHAVAGKQTNAFDLHDMSGNVSEWVEDCWNANYSGAPTDGSAWKAGNCAQRVLRGGSWVNYPTSERAASRDGGDSTVRDSDFGFRLARMLP